MTAEPIAYDDRLSAFDSSPIQKHVVPNSRHLEKDRLTCIHSLGILENLDCKFWDIYDIVSRLNKITYLCNRLLNGSACIISIVDLDRVIWISSHWAISSKYNVGEEPRYDFITF
jgi:hypothetical protein